MCLHRFYSKMSTSIDNVFVFLFWTQSLEIPCNIYKRFCLRCILTTAIFLSTWYIIPHAHICFVLDMYRRFIAVTIYISFSFSNKIQIYVSCAGCGFLPNHCDVFLHSYKNVNVKYINRWRFYMPRVSVLMTSKRTGGNFDIRKYSRKEINRGLPHSNTNEDS